MRRKILSISGTRADYGLMRPVYRAITQDEDFELVIVVTGMHLLPEFHANLDEIRSDGFGRAITVSMTLGEDSGAAMAQSFGLGVYGIAGAIRAEKPDIVLLQGDRGEMLAAAVASVHMNVPVVHMSGGDRSGSIDDSIRAAISKFSHFHLTSCRDSTERLLAMGEPASRILTVGEPFLDGLRDMPLAPAEELAQEFGLDPTRPIILATQHPVTTEVEQAAGQMRTTLNALDRLGWQTVFTFPNADAGGRAMAEVLEAAAIGRTCGLSRRWARRAISD